MSRSTREPYWVDTYGSKAKKRFKRDASKRIRSAEDVPNGKAYRKFYDPWNIVDSKYYDDCQPYFSNWLQEWVEPSKTWRVKRK